MLAAGRPGIRHQGAYALFGGDNFNRPDDVTGIGLPSGGGIWVQPDPGNLFHIESGKAVARGPGGFGFAFSNMGTDQQVITADITASGSSYWFVDLLASDATSGGKVRVQRTSAGSIELNYEIPGGGETGLASFSDPTGGATANWKFVATGGATSTLAVYVNGVYYKSTTTSALDLTDHTWFGIIGQPGTVFDNVTVATYADDSFTDTFHRANSSSLGSAYTSQTNLSIISNEAVPTTDTTGRALLLRGSSANRLGLDFAFNGRTGVQDFVLIAFTDLAIAHYVYVLAQHNPTTNVYEAVITYNNGSGEVTLNSVSSLTSFGDGATHTLGFRREADTFIASMDGADILTASTSLISPTVANYALWQTNRSNQHLRKFTTRL